MKNLLLSLGFIAIMGPICAGQSNPKAKIVVSCTTGDQLGQALCSKVRDAIAQSPRFIEVPDTEENEEKYVTINILTIVAARSIDGRQSEVAVSIVFVMNGMLLQQNVQVCDSFHIGACAGDIVTYLDSGSVGKATNKSRSLSSTQTAP